MFLKAVLVFIYARQTIIDMSIVITIYANIFPSQAFAPTFSTSWQLSIPSLNLCYRCLHDDLASMIDENVTEPHSVLLVYANKKKRTRTDPFYTSF